MTPIRRTRSFYPAVDNFEVRLSLSGIVGTHIPNGPHVEVSLPHSEPQPMTAVRGDGDLNPQPLPPGIM